MSPPRKLSAGGRDPPTIGILEGDGASENATVHYRQVELDRGYFAQSQVGGLYPVCLIAHRCNMKLGKEAARACRREGDDRDKSGLVPVKSNWPGLG